MLRWAVVPAGLALIGLFVVGCATAGDGGTVSSNPAATPVEGPSATTPVPSGPATTPPDLVPTEWIVATVTADSTGPCYRMETDQGKMYALYSSDGFTLERGTKIRVRVEPLKLRIYCGPGEHVKILKLERMS